MPPTTGTSSAPFLSNVWGILTLPINLLKGLVQKPFNASLTSIGVSNVPVIVLLYALLAYYRDYLTFHVIERVNGNNDGETFDFIVVGAGSAGAVVANRLSKDYTVLLLEAGGDPHPLSAIPTTALITLNLPLIDWGYKTVPQKYSCFALKNNASQWPRGKALGGSSVQNIMMYMRGSPHDYDYWANVTRNPEWSYDNLLPFYKKMEDYHGHHGQNGFHGQGGPLHVESLRFSPCLEYWLKAGKERGYKVQDPNAYQSQGFCPMDVTMKKGSRFSTYRGYLKPILDRKRLRIYRYAQVTKVHFDENKRAFGVTYHRHGQYKFAKASKEVVLSGGSVNTPKLLMLSGIGPKDHLQSLGIDCLVDLPVGKNLQDHIFATLGPFVLNESVSYILDRDTNLKTLYDYFTAGTGPLVSIAGISGAALLSSSLVEPQWPDLILFGIGVGVHKSFGLESDQAFGFRPNTLQRYYEPSVGKDANFVSVTLGRPKSYGYIKLRSPDPFDTPIIDPNYLSHYDDVKVLVEGVKFTVDLFEKTNTYQSLGARLAGNKLPGCEEHEFRSDGYWECYVRHFTLTMYHPCGTCRMGFGADDVNAVVDSQLRVLHTSGLRVVDASIMPNVTNANLNAPSILVGEKGADIILNFWASQQRKRNILEKNNDFLKILGTMFKYVNVQNYF